MQRLARGRGGGGVGVVGIHGVNVAVDWSITFICFKMLYSNFSKTI